jgi:hypothetical protein
MYLYPGQEVVNLLGKSPEDFQAFASRHGLRAKVHSGKATRIIAPGFVVDVDNDGPKLFIRPQGSGHDHWLQYDPSSGQMEIQDEDGTWGLRPFDNPNTPMTIVPSD